MIAGMITIAYYLMVAAVVAITIWNFVRAKSWDRELLYVIVLIPFLLRLLGLK